jgi:hypothetical protein
MGTIFRRLQRVGQQLRSEKLQWRESISVHKHPVK